MLHEYRMPDAGEGLTEAEVLIWHVEVGDRVSVNQVIVEVETAKAAVELPSPYAGTVVALLAVPGQVVPVGEPIIQIDDGHSEPTNNPVLVGYGVRPEAAPQRRPRFKALTPAAETSGGVRLSHVQRMMARAVTRSAGSAAQVTVWLDVDVSATTALIRSTRDRPEWTGVRVTPLTFAALGLLQAISAYPRINATFDDTNQTLNVHPEVGLGIAVDSERGLVVPHVPSAQHLAPPALAAAIAEVVNRARDGRAGPSDLRGSTITITNIGSLGVDSGTPILNLDQVAILALGRVLQRAWVVAGTVQARDVATLALTFDHRVIDGATGARVLGVVAAAMGNPVAIF